ncbi:beta-propeller domain-containing protein [Dactylosporangium vinaceum]|uniref:Beta-propeller domain-containing protein n=1 Tax=Dactylosporangium vinaceum TaxID=53362 RepID=A0ABV5MPF4_9ACTN|nr:beta-propeller domain-containing protein [Dactylosporangium vinaceum]UAB96768.1 beta-propeller domain-containing protein [Dactylosporangium vinaceum]
MKRAAAMLSAIGLLLSGCTAGKPNPAATSSAPQPEAALKLVAYDSCEDLAGRLRKATAEAVGPWGFGNYPGGIRTLNGGGAVPEAKTAQGTDDAAFSGTNNHEAGVDEPDEIKTDGKRIVTLSHGRLVVVDAASRQISGTLALDGASDANKQAIGADRLLLDGDRALILGFDYSDPERGGPLLTLVDLAGPPKVVSTFRIDGALLDARQVGGVARVVIRSAPRIEFPQTDGLKTDEDRIAANRSAVNAAPVEDWLPRWTSVDAAGQKTSGRVDCGAVQLPETYSGTSLLTVLTFDLNAAALGTGAPVAVAADGGVVYSNGPSLYIANDKRWRTSGPLVKRSGPAPDPRTQIFKFVIAGSGKPSYQAAGEVPGWLLNQYSLSEWDGRLRVATTANDASTVYVLEQRGGTLAEAGHVGGLGRGERIYSVRFIGTVGYVVTFKQTDPLYTLDLSSPAAPRTVGELKITGYSAYLHPAGDGRLIGVGQEASSQGRVQGLQVSLFDVHDLTAPARLAQYQVPQTGSAAEFDPHAFLYWPASGALVLPVMGRENSGALVLSVHDNQVTKTGSIEHPGRYANITRSLVIGGTLWTLSPQGLQANDLSTLGRQAWVQLA